MIFIFSYERKRLLLSVLSELEDFRPVIIDDGSDFRLDYEYFHQLEHNGKVGFWRNWDYVLKLAYQSTDDLYIFLQDDTSNIDLKRIHTEHQRFKEKPYVYSLITDKRKFAWNGIRPIKIDKYTYKMGFIDCLFFCNRKALDKLGYYITPVNPGRFVNPSISSGVGQQLTRRCLENNIPMYRSTKSFIYHGDHESKMHPELRTKQPIISL